MYCTLLGAAFAMQEKFRPDKDVALTEEHKGVGHSSSSISSLDKLNNVRSKSNAIVLEDA